jgi:hypothetical protein
MTSFEAQSLVYDIPHQTRANGFDRECQWIFRAAHYRVALGFESRGLIHR